MINIAAQSSVYVDTNVIVYMVEGNKAFSAGIERMISAIEESNSLLCTGEIAVAECLYKPYKEGASELALKYHRLFSSGDIQVIPLSSDIIEQSARYGGGIGLKLVDAFNYFSALSAGCQYFITNDRRLPSGEELIVIQLQACIDERGS